MKLYHQSTWPVEGPAAVWKRRYNALKALWIQCKTQSVESSISLERAAHALQAKEALFLCAQAELHHYKESIREREYFDMAAMEMSSDDSGAIKEIELRTQGGTLKKEVEIENLKAELDAMAEQHESYSAAQMQLVESLVHEADELKSKLTIEEAKLARYVRAAEEKEKQWETKMELLYIELMDAQDRRQGSGQHEYRFGEADERLKSSASSMVEDPTWEFERRRLLQTQQTLEVDAQRMETEMKALSDAHTQSDLDATAIREELTAALVANERYGIDARALEEKARRLSEAHAQCEHSARVLEEELTEAAFAGEKCEAEARAYEERAERLSQEKARLKEEIQALEEKALQEEEIRALQHASAVDVTEQATLWESERNGLQSANTLLREDVARTESKCKIASKVNAENVEIITTLRANLIKLSAESKSFEEEKLLQDQEKNALEREIKRLVSVNTEQTDIVSTLRRDLGEAKTVNKLLEIGKEGLEQNAERSTGMMRQLQETKNEDIFRLREALSGAAVARAELEEKIKTSESDVDALTRTYKTELQEQKRQIKSEHDEVVYELQVARDRAEREKQDDQIVNDELADLVEKMKKKMDKMNAELQGARIALDAQTQSLEAQKVEMLQSEQNKLRVVKKLQRENKGLARKLAAEEAAHENSKEMKDNLEITSRALHHKFAEFESRAQVQALQQIDLAECVRQLCGQCTSMNVKVSSLVPSAVVSHMRDRAQT
eukprot:GEMP01016758.1.p1 GENE.GEMP01016758.1~~GEMP01016758.1.p1  ORF type:complete len:730 (+),score=221.17 GEMP01016758.1:130-2319(+)